VVCVNDKQPSFIFITLRSREGLTALNENNRANFYLRGVYFLTQSPSSSNLKVSIKVVNGLKFENPGVKVATAQHIVQVNN